MARARKARTTQPDLHQGVPHAIPGPGEIIPVFHYTSDVFGAVVADHENGKVKAMMVKTDEPKCFAHETFLHELLHVIETHALARKVLKTRLSEEVIEFFAGGLLMHLAGSGLYKAVSPEEMQEWILRGAERRRKGLRRASVARRAPYVKGRPA